jgi:hypothetical protein
MEGPLHPETMVSHYLASKLISCTLISLRCPRMPPAVSALLALVSSLLGSVAMFI